MMVNFCKLLTIFLFILFIYYHPHRSCYIKPNVLWGRWHLVFYFILTGRLQLLEYRKIKTGRVRSESYNSYNFTLHPIYFENVHFFHAKLGLDVYPYDVPSHILENCPLRLQTKFSFISSFLIISDFDTHT